MNWAWYMMTVLMPLCLLVCVTLTTLQTKALRHWSNEDITGSAFSKKRELLCLYGHYIIGGLCSIQCFLCHISNLFPEIYCIYGMSICVIIYAATKTCLYGFFLERSKCVQDVSSLLPEFVWNYVLPIYIVCNLIVYLILCPLEFRGIVVDPNTHDVPTACLFGEYHAWVFHLGACVDFINCSLFLFLFVWPIYTVTKKQEELDMVHSASNTVSSDDDTTIERRRSSYGSDNWTQDLRDVVKYNVICSTICSVSSISFLITMAFAEYGSIGHYLWFGGNLDVVINSVCLFLMLGTNRQYLRHIYSKYFTKSGKNVKSPQATESFIYDAKTRKKALEAIKNIAKTDTTVVVCVDDIQQKDTDDVASTE